MKVRLSSASSLSAKSSLAGTFGRCLKHNLSYLTFLYSKLKIRTKSISFSAFSWTYRLSVVNFCCTFSDMATTCLGFITTCRC